MNKDTIKQALLLNGAKCNTKQELFSYFASKLNFPDYFGNNWDAFEEIINDISYKNVVILYNLEQYLPNDTENKTILFNILNQYNQDNKTVFYYLNSAF
jgi:RNAse (barnase) inhibitor barstar